MNILFETGPLCVLLMAFAGRRVHANTLHAVITGIVSLFFIVTAIWLFPLLFAGDFRSWIILMTNLIAVTSAWDSIWWGLEHRHMNVHRYYVWWALFWASLIAIASSNNLVLSWLAIEFSSLASGAVIVEMGNRRALEAAWKYIVIASVGLFMAVIGVLFVYASLRFQNLGWHTLDYTNIHAYYKSIPPLVRELATILIVCGIGTKAGLVPFHTWLPDAHSEAPSPASGLLSGVLLGLSLITIDMYIEAAPVPSSTWLSGTHLLLFFGCLSVLVGTLALLVQSDIKRLLAYSSIEQMGITAVGFGIHTSLGYDAALLQLGFHAVIKSSLFYLSGHLSIRYGSKRLKQITNIAALNRPLGVAWAILMLALAGLPPMGLAYSEWMILLGLWQGHLWGVLVVVSLSLVLGFAALVHHLMAGLWGAQTTATVDRVEVAEPMVRDADSFTTTPLTVTGGTHR